MLVVSGLAVFTMALLTTVLTNKRTVTHQDDEHKLSSAVESVAILAAEQLWSNYLESQGGAAGTIYTFRTYLQSLDVQHDDGVDPPKKADGRDLLPNLQLPGFNEEESTFNGVEIESVNVVRRDDGIGTQLFFTVSARTSRGAGVVNPALNRAVQQVFTIEPEEFSGFDYAMLANNINCIFCHTSVDSVERWFNHDASNYGSFDRVKVGSLESIMLRKDMTDGDTSVVNDYDADSFIAGSLVSRGAATLHDGTPITDWPGLSFQGYEFTPTGEIVQDDWGEMTMVPFDPAGDPPQAFENLYLDYATAYPEMVDGNLPLTFPAAIPDDGGIDPDTGLPDPSAMGNKIVDDAEYASLASSATGAITAGILTLVDHGYKIDTITDYGNALFTGNRASLQQDVNGNVIMTGTQNNPITIDGTVAINGDLIINGYVKGEGTLIVRGNVYVPTDLQYLDGKEWVINGNQLGPYGPRTFGIAADGTRNALGLAAGGNILVGDFQRPSTLQHDWSWVEPGKFEIVTGNPDTGDPMVDNWSFTLAEMSLFNRGEWAKTQPMLPGSPGEADLPPNQWTAVNPNYIADYVPRYYGQKEDTIIPIYNRGDIYYDLATGTWLGDEEVPISWDNSLLSYADPTNPTDPYLFNTDGTPKAVNYSLNPTDSWIREDLYKMGVEYFEDNRAYGEAMKIDGLLYTNNSIFTLVNRVTPMAGRMVVNGSIVAANIGMLVPGLEDPLNLSGNQSPLSDYAIGLQLNYDRRVKKMLTIKNPFQVQMRRTLWNPTANIQ